MSNEETGKLEKFEYTELDKQMVDYYYNAVNKGNKSISDIGSVYESDVLEMLYDDLEKNIIKYPALKSLAEFIVKKIRAKELSIDDVHEKLKFKVQAMLLNE